MPRKSVGCFCGSCFFSFWLLPLFHFSFRLPLVVSPRTAAKKQRTEEDPPFGTNQNPSFILLGGPELLQNVRTFLSLKESLALRSTCAQLHDDGHDTFRYCCLMDDTATTTEKVKRYMKQFWAMYLSPGVSVQQRLLCATVFENMDKLRALLLNKTFQGKVLRYFLWNPIGSSNTDTEKLSLFYLRMVAVMSMWICWI